MATSTMQKRKGLRSRLSALALLTSVTVAVTGCVSNDAGIPDEQRFGDEYWARLAQNFEPFVPEPGIGAAISETDWIELGRWGPVINWPQIAVGAANRPDGRIMTWSAEFASTFGSKLERNIASVFDPETQQFVNADFDGHNMFCAGVAMLPDGEVLLAGGGQTVSETSIFEGEEFVADEKLHLARWYPTSTTLPSGQVLTSLGTKTAPWSEMWTEGQGWQLLDEFSLDFILDENVGINYRDWYPALTVSPDGTLFHTGPMTELFTLDLHANDPITRHGPRIGGEKDRLYGTSVMYDVGKLLVAGGGNNNSLNTAITIDVNGATPVVQAIDPMQYKRAMQNSLVLPNGEVLVIGGNSSGQQFSDDGTVLVPELWNPDTQQWRSLAPHEKPRNYHSTALLLQDATVISMGGGLCGGCPTNHQNGEIFEPPYLFDAAGNYAERPEITNGTQIALPGDAVRLEGSDDITTFNMLRLIAITHHHSTDQRFIPLTHKRVGAGQYDVEIHANPNVAIPGYYWIFGLSADGVPSEGHLIKVNVVPENTPVSLALNDNVEFEYYEGSWNNVPNFNALTPVTQGTQPDFSLTQRERSGDYAFRFRGQLDVPVSGQYQFYLASDDGSIVSVDGNVVVNHDGKHPFTSEETGNPVFLTAGAHDIEVGYFETDGGDALLVSWSGPQFDKTPITASDLGGGPTPIAVPPAFVNFTNSSNAGIAASDGLISYEYYEGDWTVLPDFDSLLPIKTGTIDNITLDPKDVDDFYAFRYQGKIEVPLDGEYTFYLKSDDGSKLIINDQTVVDNDGTHSAFFDVPGAITLTAGAHDLTVEYFERTGLDSLQVSWEGPDLAKDVLPDTAFVSADDVDQNVFIPFAALPESVPGEVTYNYFEGDWISLPDFNDLVALDQGSTDSIALTDNRADDLYAYQFAAYLEVDQPGVYTFFLQSDDGSRLEINGQTVVEIDGVHAFIEGAGTIALAAGRHHILVSYFERLGGDDLAVTWSGPGFARQSIPGERLSSAPIQFTAAPSLDGDAMVYSYYEGNWSALPDFSTLTAKSSGQAEQFTLEPAGEATHFGMVFEADLLINTGGDYTFYTNSNDGSQLLINDQLIVDNDGKHAMRLDQGLATLTAGRHKLELRYFQSGGGKGLEVSWAGPGFDQRLLPASVTFAPSDIDSSIVIVDASDNTDSGDNSANNGGDSNPNAAPAQGQLSYQYFEGQWDVLPDFDTLTAVNSGVADNFDLPATASLFYGVRYTGTIEITADGDYEFFVNSNDGSRLFINGAEIVNNDGKHAAVEVSGEVTLTAGFHDIELQYFQSGGTEALGVEWQGPGFAKQVIPDELLYGP